MLLRYGVLALCVVSMSLACKHKKPAASSTVEPKSTTANAAKDAYKQSRRPTKATVTLHGLKNSGVSGDLTLNQEAEGVRVKGEVRGLAPNSTHGFHIHEHGDCSAADGSSAGGHFAPLGHPHGALADASSHAGDLGNIKANAEGIAEVSLFKQDLTLAGKHGVLGRAVIVHEKADDLHSQPSGAAGSRVACGVLMPVR